MQQRLAQSVPYEGLIAATAAAITPQKTGSSPKDAAMKSLLFVPAVLIMVACSTCEAATGDDLVEILRVVHALTDDRARGSRASTEHRSHFAGSRDEWKQEQAREQRELSTRHPETRTAETSRNFRDMHNSFMNGSPRENSRSSHYRPQPVPVPVPAPAPRSTRDNVRFGLSINLGSGSIRPSYAPVYTAPAPAPRTILFPQPVPGPVCLCPHQIGEFVDTRVPLATCVRVRNLHKAAPNAVPAVIAVRDPDMCEHDSEETVAYVRILVPPQPLRSLEISPCRTKLTLCFGQYDVLICSSNGRITVEYDN